MLLLILVGVSFAFVLYEPGSWSVENSIANFFASFMIYYLVLVCVRTMILLVLSFLEVLTNQKVSELKVFPLVTLIVPCFNEGKVLREAIESAVKIDYPNIEILIVDDGSTDDTFVIAKEMEEFDSRVRVIYQPNGGKSAALNNGISQAHGDYFICMDADSVLSSNVLLVALSFFEKDQNLAAVAGAVIVGNAKSILTFFQRLEYIVGLNFHKMGQSFLNMVTIVPGPIGVFKKSCVLKINGYATDTFAEDCDLSMRLLMEGFNIKYTGKIYAVTEAPDSILQLVTQRYRWSRGMVQAILKAIRIVSYRFSLRSLAVISFMTLETILIPVINFLFIILTLQFALNYGTMQLMGPFFIGLTILDLSLCLYAIISEREVFSLFFFGLVNKITYGLFLEVIRFYAIIDELFRLPMKWGVLIRKGMK